jgi:intracellular multiplication protein IcmK
MISSIVAACFSLRLVVLVFILISIPLQCLAADNSALPAMPPANSAQSNAINTPLTLPTQTTLVPGQSGQLQPQTQTQMQLQPQASLQLQPGTEAQPSQPQPDTEAQPMQPQNGQAPNQNKPAGKQPSVSQQAFAGVVEKQLPMTPEQIISLHNAFEATQKAAAMPPDVPARPATSSILVNLSPNSVPPVIRLGAGYISSLVFVDSTGQPWPIQAYSVGDPNAFNIQWDQKGNTLLVQADTFYKRSNLAVMLRDLNTPVMLTLLPGQSAIDYRVDLRIPGSGPNATYYQEDLPSAADPILLDVLNGVQLRGAKALRVIGGDNNSQAWLMNNKLYLRTSLTVISPAWKAIMTSIDGMHAYELQPSSVILALQRGKEHAIKIILEGLQ